jgi:hypothetical protein
VANSTAWAQLWPATARQPFIERIEPADYLAVEALMPEQPSLKSELVIVRTEDGKPQSAVAISRGPNAEYFVVHLFDLDVPSITQAVKKPQRTRTQIPFAVAKSVKEIFDRKLHRFVMVASEPVRVADHAETAWWIFFRDPRDVAVTAFVSVWTTHQNQEAFDLLPRLTSGLAEVADAQPQKLTDTIERLENFLEQMRQTEAAGY